MKKIALMPAALLAATTCFGAMVEANMMEMRVFGEMDFDSPTGHVETQLDLGLGYFVQDDVQVGGLLGFENKGKDYGFGAGVFSEVIFDLLYHAAPFVGTSIQFRFGDFYTSNHLLVEFNGGIKVFMTEYMAVSGMVFYNLASDNIYEKRTRDRDDKNDNAGMRVGLSVYF